MLLRTGEDERATVKSMTGRKDGVDNSWSMVGGRDGEREVFDPKISGGEGVEKASRGTDTVSIANGGLGNRFGGSKEDIFVEDERYFSGEEASEMALGAIRPGVGEDDELVPGTVLSETGPNIG